MTISIKKLLKILGIILIFSGIGFYFNKVIIKDICVKSYYQHLLKAEYDKAANYLFYWDKYSDRPAKLPALAAKNLYLRKTELLTGRGYRVVEIKDISRRIDDGLLIYRVQGTYEVNGERNSFEDELYFINNKIMIENSTDPYLRYRDGKIARIFQESYDEGLIFADLNNLIQEKEKKSEYNGIIVFVRGAIADGVRTVLKVAVEGKYPGKEEWDFGNIQLIDGAGKRYLPVKWSKGSEDETLIEFAGSPTKNTDVTLTLKRINGVEGKWEVKFPLKVFRPVELGFNISGKEHGNELKIKKIIFAKTITKIEGEISGDDLFEETYAIIAGNKINFKSVSVDNQSHKINLYLMPVDYLKVNNLKIVIKFSNPGTKESFFLNTDLKW
ncbi:hypothetical protein [Carboxydothermus hydrogenoformans]|uniref:hypothetical protein n=1 Tax=Carboxydothermus hydrogenoformans TaxID=129958 RepID=UPI00031C7226|nr:hypothetical protein [Carboxydothermus hydrogenoformans]